MMRMDNKKSVTIGYNIKIFLKKTRFILLKIVWFHKFEVENN